MADDSTMQGLIKLVLERIDRSDDRTDEKIQSLIDQHTRDKADAIARGETQHAENQGELKSLNEKATLTGGRVSVIEKIMDEEIKPVLIWHREEGVRLVGRVSILEQAKLAEAAERALAAQANAGQEGERRGRAWMIARVIGLIVAIGSVLGWLGADRLSALLFRVAGAIGHG